MTRYLYVGTETRARSGAHRKEGIFVYRMNPESGELNLVQAVESGENPTFLALHPNRRYLYAINEIGEGRATAFRVDPGNGYLQMLNTEPINGRGPCYVSLSADGAWLLAACYAGGSLSVLPVERDGRVGKVSDVVQHAGTGPNAQRQEAAHAHSILPDPSGRFILAADLGTDKVHVYRLEDGKLRPNDPPWGMTEPGAGPRHIAFHPGGKWAYVSTEMGNTVAVFAWDDRAGKLELVKSLPTLPEDFSEHSQIAHIALSPDGKRLYVSNRGHDSLAVFNVLADGGLERVGIAPTGGHWPRNFCVDPDGRFVVAANERSDTLVVQKVDEKGMPAPVGEPVEVTRPMFVMAVDL